MFPVDANQSLTDQFWQLTASFYTKSLSFMSTLIDYIKQKAKKMTQGTQDSFPCTPFFRKSVGHEVRRRASCACPLKQPKAETCCTGLVAHIRVQGAALRPTFLHAGPRFAFEAVEPTQRPVQTSPTGSASTAVSVLTMHY